MPRVGLLALVVELAWTGIVSLGGGRAVYFYDSLVIRRRWITTDQFVQDTLLSGRVPPVAVVVAAGCVGWLAG